MTCSEFVRWLHAYCDGELDASTMLELGGHLEGCPSCRRAVEAEHAFRAELRGTLSQEPVPPHLVEKLRSAIAELDEGEKRSARMSTWGGRASWLALAASVLLLSLGGLLGFLIGTPRSGTELHPLVAQLVSEHMKFAPLENPAELSSGDTQQVAFWVQERTGHRVQVPDYSSAGIRLLGGRVTRLGGHRAAYIVYEKGRNIISLFSFPRYGGSRKGLEEIRQECMVFRTAEYMGRQILLWDSGEMTYALVSDVGWDELVQCALVFSQAAKT
jgi:anti-sigma factor (TIGR02949 family)